MQDAGLKDRRYIQVQIGRQESPAISDCLRQAVAFGANRGYKPVSGSKHGRAIFGRSGPNEFTQCGNPLEAGGALVRYVQGALQGEASAGQGAFVEEATD